MTSSPRSARPSPPRKRPRVESEKTGGKDLEDPLSRQNATVRAKQKKQPTPEILRCVSSCHYKKHSISPKMPCLYKIRDTIRNPTIVSTNKLSKKYLSSHLVDTPISQTAPILYARTCCTKSFSQFSAVAVRCARASVLPPCCTATPVLRYIRGVVETPAGFEFFGLVISRTSII